jgi:lysophospholipase L1-like esterase
MSPTKAKVVPLTFLCPIQLWRKHMKGFVRRGLVLVLAAVLLSGLAARCMAQTAEFPLKEGDIVAMLGDSITAQHLHTNYIEAYCITRFPKWNLQFRNAGVGGDTVPRGLARLDYDVLCWKPTVVTIELGMNDSRTPDSVEPYIKGMETLIQRLKAGGARPIFLTASPVNNGATSDKLDAKNSILDKMATAIVELAGKQGLPCSDQFHTLLDLWGKNMKAEKPIPLAGDAVHPGPPGQVTMAYACLVGLNAPALVSQTTIDAAGSKVVSAEKCAINDLKVAGEVVSFERADECLPMPIPEDGRAGLQLVPLTEKLNQYVLKIEGLKGDKYDVSIDGVKVATVSAQELANGWNMSELTGGPIAAQCKSVLGLVAKKEVSVGAYRDVSKFQVPDWLKDPALDIEGRKKAELDKRMQEVVEASAELNKATQPKPHRFEIAPGK